MISRFVALLIVLSAVPLGAASPQVKVSAGHTETFRLGSFTAASGDRVRISSDEVWEGNVYAAGGEVDVDGTVTGDLFAGTGRFELRGRVGEDLTAGGGNVMIKGEVGGDARILAGDTRIEGTIDGELLLCGGVLIVGPSAVIKGPSVIYAGQVIIEGTMEGPAEIGAGQVRIEGTVEGDVRVQSDELSFGPLSRIGGDLVYAARSSVEVPEGAVAGTVTRNERPVKEDWDEKIDEAKRALGAFTLFKTIFSLFLAFVALLAGVLMLLFFRPFVDGALNRASAVSSVGVSFGVGLVSVLVMLVFGILCIWLVPLSLALWSGFGALLYFGSVLGKMVVGRFALLPLMGRAAHPLLALLIGILLMLVLGFVPILGDLIWWLVTITGIGIALLQIRGGDELPEQLLAGAAAPGLEQAERNKG